MSANLAFRGGRYSFAFSGDRAKIWHRDGQQANESWTLDQWLEAAGLDYEATLIPAYGDFNGQRINHGFLNVHNKTGHAFGHVSHIFKNVQPREIAESFLHYIENDKRFSLSAMGALGVGERVWATAEFADFKAGGEAHKAYLLASTAFDGSAATTHRATFVRGVCQNTVTAAMLDKRAVISTRHSTRYDAEKTARELEAIVQSVDAYKAMGDAMADTRIGKDVIGKFFKRLLEIPFDAKSEDISARKLNQYSALSNAYGTTVREGAEKETAWAALNAVTRYVDHDRSTRNANGSPDAARFASATFGSGAAMKAEAVRLLTVDEDFRALLKSPMVSTMDRDAGDDVKALLAGAFKPSWQV